MWKTNKGSQNTVTENLETAHGIKIHKFLIILSLSKMWKFEGPELHPSIVQVSNQVIQFTS